MTERLARIRLLSSFFYTHQMIYDRSESLSSRQYYTTKRSRMDSIADIVGKVQLLYIAMNTTNELESDQVAI